MQPAGEPGEVTVLLRRWRNGDEHAYDRLVSSVYDRLLVRGIEAAIAACGK